MHRLDPLDIVRPPVIDDRGELGLRAELDHVGRLAERLDAALGSHLHRTGRIGVLGDDVDTLVDQRLGGVGFLARVEPGIGPHDLDLEVGIDGLRAEHERVDAHHHLGDRERGDVARHAGLGEAGRDHALDVTALVELRVVGRDVRVLALVTGRMLELDVGKLGRDLVRRIHVAERGGEDDVAARTCEALQCALGIGAFRHAFQIGGLDGVAERFLDLEPALVVLIRPAEIADRADIDETRLGLFLRKGAGRKQHGGRCGKRE